MQYWVNNAAADERLKSRRLATPTSDRDVACDLAGDYFWNRPQTVVFWVKVTDVAIDGGVEPIPFAGKSRLVRLSFSVARLAIVGKRPKIRLVELLVAWSFRVEKQTEPRALYTSRSRNRHVLRKLRSAMKRPIDAISGAINHNDWSLSATINPQTINQIWTFLVDWRVARAVAKKIAWKNHPSAARIRQQNPWLRQKGEKVPDRHSWGHPGLNLLDFVCSVAGLGCIPP